MPSRTILRNVKPNSTFSSLFLASLEGVPYIRLSCYPSSPGASSPCTYSPDVGGRASRKCSVLLSAGTVPEEGNM